MCTINVVLSPSSAYSKYCYLTILSILDCANEDDFYDVYILYDNLSFENMHLLKSVEGQSCKISFIDVNEWIDKKIMLDRGYVSKNTYFRIIAPLVLSHKERFVYVDSDMIVNKDLNGFYSMDLKDKTIGAVRNWSTNAELEYISKELNISNKTYFNAGIVLFDVKKYIENDISQKCIQLLSKKQYKYFDQDILNLVLKDDVMLTDSRWNVVWHPISNPGVMSDFPKSTKLAWYSASREPYIVHYTSAVKPWNTIGLTLSEYFWKIAKKSTIYCDLIEELMTNMDNIMINQNLLPYLIKQQETGKVRYSDIVKVFIKCTKIWIRKKIED